MKNVISLNSEAQAHVNAYFEYKNIVGDLDGGKLLSEKEYKKFREDAMKAQKNRIYVSWINKNSNLECRSIGPSSKCFCNHRFREHKSDAKDKKLFCRMPKCKCKCFEYIPIRGAQDLKCHCKHSYKDHDILSKKCNQLKPGYKQCECLMFFSSFGCSCGNCFYDHLTIFETRDERIKQGKAVDNWEQMSNNIIPMGGLTGFTSLLDGIDRPQQQISINNLNNLRFIKPKKKLNEEEEMALYAKKYDSKTNNISKNLRLLKSKNELKDNKVKYDMHPNDLDLIQNKINELQIKLKNPKLTSMKKYALNKELKMEKSKIIKAKRKAVSKKAKDDALMSK